MTTRGEENSPDRSQGSYEDVATDVPRDGEDLATDLGIQARTPRFARPPGASAGGSFPTPNSPGPGGMTLTEDQFRIWMQAFQQPTKPEAPVAPRVGGLNRQGCWTGFGLNSQGVEPRTADCMREFFHDGIKEFNALGEIQKRCREGLSSNPECPRFCQAHEKDAHQFVRCVQELKRFCEDHGMEGVFRIVQANNGPIDLFKRPGFVDEKMTLEWVDALTNKGVHDPEGGRLRVCRFDLLNLRLSGMAILNSCSDLLKQAIERAIPEEEKQVGPLVYYNVIQRIQPPSHTQTRSLADKLKALDLRKIKGENMTQYQADAMKIIDEIYMSVLDELTIPDLASLALMGLQDASDEQLRLKAGRLLDNADQTLHDCTDPAMLLELLNQLYVHQMHQQLYAPAKSIKSEIAAMQAKIKELKQSLVQDCTKTSTSKPKMDVTCYECGEKGHIKPDCPKLKAAGKTGKASSTPSSNTTKSDSASKGSKSSNSNDEATKINQAIKDKLKELPSSVEDDAKLTVTVNGKVVAKYCKRCKRYTKGSSAHFTTEHRGKSSTQVSTTTASPTASLAAIDEAPEDVDSPALFRCEVPDYDTPVLVHRESSSDSSLDSTYQAFVAATTDPDQVPLVQDSHSEEGAPLWYWWALNEFRGQDP